MLGALVGWVTSVVQTLGYPGLVAMMLLEVVFPPIPSELILPLAGFLTGQGEMNFVGAVAAATFGSVAGALVLYYLGARLGEERLRGFIRRYGRWMLLCESDLDKAQGWFNRHGGEAVLICRMLPVARSLISVPAGLQHMPIWKFLAYTTIGTAIFDGVLIGLGWWLGSRWQAVEQYASYFEYGGLALLAGGIAWFAWKRLKGGGAVCDEESREDHGRGEGHGREDGARASRSRSAGEIARGNAADYADDLAAADAGRERR